MKIISVVNKKGGVGKTTIAINLATYLASRSYKVFFLDSDEQGSAFNWFNKNPKENIKSAHINQYCTSPETTNTFLKKVKKDYTSNFDICIIDGEPKLNSNQFGILTQSNLILLPLHLSAFDLLATNSVLGISFFNENNLNVNRCSIKIIINGFEKNTLNQKLLNDLSNTELHKGLLMHTKLHHRLDYKKTVYYGKTLIDLPKTNKARLEFEAVAKEILYMLK